MGAFGLDGLSFLHPKLSDVETMSIGHGEAAHVISGPITENKKGGRRRNQQSALASAFENAWKQGTLASEVRRKFICCIIVRVCVCVAS